MQKPGLKTGLLCIRHGSEHDGIVKSPDAALRFILRHCGAFRGHVPIPLGFRNMSPIPHSSGPGAQTGSPACGADGAQERTGFSSLPGLAVRRAVSQPRALPAAFLRNRPIFATFKTFYEIVNFGNFMSIMILPKNNLCTTHSFGLSRANRIVRFCSK